MQSNTFIFEGIDPILSFSKDGKGYKDKVFINTKGEKIDSPSGLWSIGYKAFLHLSPPGYEPLDLALMQYNMREIINFFNSLFNHDLEWIKEEKFILQDERGELLDGRGIGSIKKYTLIDKVIFIVTVSSQLDGFFVKEIIPRYYFAYTSLMVLDGILVEPVTWDIEDCKAGTDALIYTAEKMLNVIETFNSIELSASHKSKAAANKKHIETYKFKESLREWHKLNRHDFLKSDGTINQNQAAEHVKYVLRMTTLGPKKIAEYMGEFEKEFHQK